VSARNKLEATEVAEGKGIWFREPRTSSKQQ